MTKMYYTDILKSAWMVREFGVKFYTGAESIADGKFHIDPQSQYIFEPQVRDVVQWSLYKGKFIEEVLTAEAHEDLLEALASGDKSVSDIKIIQRNGKPFFMPEVEDETD